MYYNSKLDSELCGCNVLTVKLARLGIVKMSISRTNGFITLIYLFFKAMNVTLKYALFLKIENVALYQERTILIVSKFHRQQTS